MKNILNVIRHDARKITSSVVATIMIIGLCLVPCLYAWSNIFSNWDPYEKESTSRISVAVASEDEGSTTMGVEVNVGETVMDALKSNDSIGWVFVNSEDKAKRGVRSGEYYAALVIPEDFTRNVLSFLNGTPNTPKMHYYENIKKNAIAQKITDKARSSMRDEINSQFVAALASILSKSATAVDNAGYDPQIVFGDLSKKMDELSDDLERCTTTIDTAKAMTSSTGTLLNSAAELLGNTKNTLKAGDDLLDTSSDSLKDMASTASTLSKNAQQLASQLSSALLRLNKDLDKIIDNRQAYNAFVENDLKEKRDILDEMRTSTADIADQLDKVGLTILASQFRELSEHLKTIVDTMDKLKKVEDDEGLWTQMKKQLEKLKTTIGKANNTISSIDAQIQSGALDKKLQKAVKSTRASITKVRKSLSSINGDLGGLSKSLQGYDEALSKLNNGLDSTDLDIAYARKNIDALASLFSQIADAGAITDTGNILQDENLVTYLTSPVTMKKEILFPIRNYGSSMASFYTVLAQWVCALLATTLIKTGIRRRKDLPELNTREKFFGRYGLYLFIGLVQALVVSIGDLFYVQIQCNSPGLFVLAAIINGITFSAINYALVFTLGNVGMAASLIILVVQVAGASGTFPVDVAPPIFQALYPFMPLHYAMDAMRECVGGTFGNIYLHHLAILVLFTLGAIAFGILMYKPGQMINKLIEDGKEKAEIME